MTSLEKRTGMMIALALVAFVLTRAFHHHLYAIYNPNNYLSFHTVFEFFSISVSFSIAFAGFLIFPHSLSKHRLILGAVFLAVGFIDLLHTISFKGMPFFFTPSSAAKATWFWILARLTESVSLLWLFSWPDKPVASSNRIAIYGLSFLYASAIGWLVIVGADSLPVLVNEGQGTTILKNVLEYFISTFHLITIGVLFYQYGQDREAAHLTLISALAFLFFSELTFTLYKSVYDFDNLLGHLYKIIGYYYLFKGIYISTIEEPYVRQLETEKKLRESEERYRKANEKLMTLSLMDGLTGIANRRYFSDYLQREWYEGIRLSSSLSLILVDIDYFKAYNDTYGHLRGDDCLKEVACILSQTAQRSSDLVARYGGEEFAVILPHTDHKGALLLANEIRAAVEQRNIPHKGSQSGNCLTVSVGVATIIPSLSAHPGDLINMADQALYEAKRNGRNQVVAYENSLVSPVL